MNTKTMPRIGLLLQLAVPLVLVQVGAFLLGSVALGGALAATFIAIVMIVDGVAWARNHPEEHPLDQGDSLFKIPLTKILFTTIVTMAAFFWALVFLG